MALKLRGGGEAGTGGTQIMMAPTVKGGGGGGEVEVIIHIMRYTE